MTVFLAGQVTTTKLMHGHQVGRQGAEDRVPGLAVMGRSQCVCLYVTSISITTTTNTIITNITAIITIVVTMIATIAMVTINTINIITISTTTTLTNHFVSIIWHQHHLHQHLLHHGQALSIPPPLPLLEVTET